MVNMNCLFGMVMISLSSLGAAELMVARSEVGTCALYYGQVSCWGFGTRIAPMLLDMGDFYPTGISCAWAHCCAWNTDPAPGHLKCWAESLCSV